MLAVLGFAASGLFASPYDHEDGNVRVVAGYMQSLKYEDIGSAVAGFSCSDVSGGKYSAREFSFEWLAGRWKTNRYDRFDKLADTTRELHMPVTVNCRYYLRAPRLPVSLYAGAGAGLHMITNSFSPDFFVITEDPDTGKVNGWVEFFKRFDYAVTATGMVGLKVNVNKRSGIDIGMRWTWQSGSSHTFDDDSSVWTRQDYSRMVTVSGQFAF